MAKFEANSIAFVKLSGEPVFVLFENQNPKYIYKDVPATIDQGLFRKSLQYTRKEIVGTEMQSTGFYFCRRYVPSTTGSYYMNETFSEAELETEEEVDARKKADMEEMLGSIVASASVEQPPTPTPSTAN